MFVSRARLQVATSSLKAMPLEQPSQYVVKRMNHDFLLATNNWPIELRMLVNGMILKMNINDILFSVRTCDIGLQRMI